MGANDEDGTKYGAEDGVKDEGIAEDRTEDEDGAEDNMEQWPKLMITLISIDYNKQQSCWAVRTHKLPSVDSRCSEPKDAGASLAGFPKLQNIVEKLLPVSPYNPLSKS